MTSTAGERNLAPQARYDVETLCKDYCPPLEAGLVYALASDFDLDDPDSLRELRQALDELKGSAVIEQDLELLPQESESHEGRKTTSDSINNEQKKESTNKNSSDNSRSGPRSATDEDAITSITTGFSGMKHSDVDGSESGYASGYGEASVDFEKLPNDEKCKWLSKMFPKVELQDVRDIVDRYNGDFDRSTDELLNISFLNENNQDHGNQEYTAPKGIDGFLQETTTETRRKGKGKGRRNKSRASNSDLTEPWASDSAISSGAATPNIWKDLPEDVEFIVSRTYLKSKTVASYYHANGARLAPTIRALAIKEGEIYAKSPQKVDQILELQMDELRADYGHVSDAQIYGVLTMTNNIPSAAMELLDAMIQSNEQPILLGKVTGLASYTPINLSDDESKPKRASGGAWPSATPSSGGVYTTSHLSNTHGLAATQAFQQASAAYRRGKSDHLMGGAAAYYASVGHEKIKAAKSIQAAAADAHVASQSSTNVLDLHGVNVSDAVRIAQNGAEAWWEGLGDRKYVVGGKGDGYRIVTGVGRHRSDGIGRIGPAVSKMLVREGWKVEVGRGEIVVSGRARK